MGDAIFLAMLVANTTLMAFALAGRQQPQQVIRFANKATHPRFSLRKGLPRSPQPKSLPRR